MSDEEEEYLSPERHSFHEVDKHEGTNETEQEHEQVLEDLEDGDDSVEIVNTIDRTSPETKEDLTGRVQDDAEDNDIISSYAEHSDHEEEDSDDNVDNHKDVNGSTENHEEIEETEDTRQSTSEQLLASPTALTSPVTDRGVSASHKATSSVDSIETKARGTISHDSYYNGTNDRLVSRLASKFESHIEDEKKPYVKAELKTFSRSRAKQIGISLMNGAQNSSPTDEQLSPQLSRLPLRKPSSQFSPNESSSEVLKNLTNGSSDSLSDKTHHSRASITSPNGGLEESQISRSLSEKSKILTGKPRPLRTGSTNSYSESSSRSLSDRNGTIEAEDTDNRATNTRAETESGSFSFESENNHQSEEVQVASVVATSDSNQSDVTSIENNKIDDSHDSQDNRVEPTEMMEDLDGSQIMEKKTLVGEENAISTHLSPSKRPRQPTSFSLQPIEIKEDKKEDNESDLIFGACVVGFHHARGPEVEYWVGPDGDKSAVWPYLPFQSLPDGSHSHEENFCYFTLLYDEKSKAAPNPTPVRSETGQIENYPDMSNVTTLFGIACNRQMSSSDLKHMTEDITRSTVQKSVVIVARKPIFGSIKEKLAVVTRAYFSQGDFEDRSIIENLYENLRQIFSNSKKLDESELNIGMPLREIIYRLKSKLLMILKALLLEKKVLFFSSNTELLCASQFSLVSLIPNLMNYLEDCGSPLLCTYETKLKKPTSLKTSDRGSLLAFIGLPLQLFAYGGLFSPYVPLQQLKELKADETKYFLVGSTNSLLIAPKSELADVVVNMDTNSVDILNSSLRSVLSLSSPDKKWMDSVVRDVMNTWEDEGLEFTGSEDHIRIQFEDYIMHLLSCVKYEEFLSKHNNVLTPFPRDIQGNPIKLYNSDWVNEWKKSNNFRIFKKFTDEELFDIVEPMHMGSSKSTGLDVPKQLNSNNINNTTTTTTNNNNNNNYRGSIKLDASQAREKISQSVSRVWGSFWEPQNLPKPSNDSTSMSTNTSPRPVDKDDNMDQVSITDSVKTQSTESSTPARHASKASVASMFSTRSGGTMSFSSGNSSQNNTEQKKEGYFAGWGRWAANRRQPMPESTLSPNLQPEPKANFEE